jgi:hypothetical protein
VAYCIAVTDENPSRKLVSRVAFRFDL